MNTFRKYASYVLSLLLVPLAFGFTLVMLFGVKLWPASEDESWGLDLSNWIISIGGELSALWAKR